ncbi:uncharacterized protein LOC143037576 [Oratosquilla oratoria]|uniref:uncharacterized protein LOC143037576 n=1 Tax=Oratosquilla oratoria TaxID=337810 RepID=UPI003F76E695
MSTMSARAKRGVACVTSFVLKDTPTCNRLEKGFRRRKGQRLRMLSQLTRKGWYPLVPQPSQLSGTVPTLTQETVSTLCHITDDTRRKPMYHTLTSPSHPRSELSIGQWPILKSGYPSYSLHGGQDSRRRRIHHAVNRRALYQPSHGSPHAETNSTSESTVAVWAPICLLFRPTCTWI